MTNFHPSILAWLQLLRVPNLFTAPGDSLAGACLTAALQGGQLSCRTAVGLALASTLFYAFGLAHNDLRDYAEDCRERPERPLPSGRLTTREATVCTVLLAIVGLGTVLWLLNLVAFFFSLLLCLVIFCYNHFTKHQRLAGSLNMGFCRGMNFLLGFSAALTDNSCFTETWPVLIPMLGVTFYIAAVTWLADRENTTQRVNAVSLLPAYLCAASWFLTVFHIPRPAPLALFCSFLPLTGCFYLLEGIGRKLYRQNVGPAIMQPAIGGYLRPLIFWQISWVLLLPTPLAFFLALLLLAGHSLSRKLSRYFAQS